MGGDEAAPEGNLGNLPLPPMTEAETAALRDKVRELRRTLPDPSAGDIADGNAPEMAAWATPGRVKKLNTKLNKEVKGKDYARDGCEPDETDGPLVGCALLTSCCMLQARHRLMTDSVVGTCKQSSEHPGVTTLVGHPLLMAAIQLLCYV
jgi:hypothetical protein